jgi:periplasmic divalent cation tolerance protein
MAEEILLALSTFPNAGIARRVASQIVNEHLAACANILPDVQSIYFWKNKLETGKEVLVLFKMSQARQDAFETKLKALHPYEIPEIFFVDVQHASYGYVRWVLENSSG